MPEEISFVKNPDRNGFKAWRKIVHHFDPREGVDATVAYERVANPTPVKTITDAKVKLPLWEAEVRKYESKYKDPMSDSAKSLALKTLIPKQLMGNRFVGMKFDTFDKYLMKSRTTSGTGQSRKSGATRRRTTSLWRWIRYLQKPRNKNSPKKSSRRS